MAMFFQLGVEVGKDYTNAENFAEHFHNLTIILSEVDIVNTLCGIHNDEENPQNLWCVVTVEKAPSDRSTIYDLFTICDRGKKLIELSYFLYQCLLTAPRFRFALVSIEVFAFLTYQDLIATDTPLLPSEGLVINREIWEIHDRPKGYTEFKPGYYWTPFKGDISLGSTQYKKQLTIN